MPQNGERRAALAGRSGRVKRPSDESGFIIIGGGGGGSGRGCLFWILVSIILSVTLTVLANVVLYLAS